MARSKKNKHKFRRISERNGRIRRTLTEWQSALSLIQNNIVMSSWHHCIPEIILFSIAFEKNSFKAVFEDFQNIVSIIESKYGLTWDGTFSSLISVINYEPKIMNEFDKTSLKEAFMHITMFYLSLFYPNHYVDIKENALTSLMIGYYKILRRKNDFSILCKYLFIKHYNSKEIEIINKLNFETNEEILQIDKKSIITSTWLILITEKNLIDYEFSESIWNYNYSNSPFIEDEFLEELDETIKTKIMEQLKLEFQNITNSFKDINLIEDSNRYTIEVHIGLINRLINLSEEVISLVESHKGEIAEATLRLIYENRVKLLWLVKRNDIKLIKSYREFKVGRDKLFHEQFLEDAKENPKLNSLIQNSINEYNRILDSEKMEDYEVSIERGDPFEINLAEMAKELGEKEQNFYDIFYKKTSDIIHGNWRIVEKYHLNKSLNPMHGGLLSYNNNPNQYNGVMLSYYALLLASDTFCKYFEFSSIEKHEFIGLSKSFHSYKDKIISLIEAEIKTLTDN